MGCGASVTTHARENNQTAQTNLRAADGIVGTVVDPGNDVNVERSGETPARKVMPSEDEEDLHLPPEDPHTYHEVQQDDEQAGPPTPERSPTPEPVRERTPEPYRDPTPEQRAPTPEPEVTVTVNNIAATPSPYNPRLCHLIRYPHFQGIGFNLHADKDKNGQNIGMVDDGSPAADAGLLEGDRIIEVDGVNIEDASHPEVIQRIKAGGDETKLLVVDPAADEYYKNNGIRVTADMPEVIANSSKVKVKVEVEVPEVPDKETKEKRLAKLHKLKKMANVIKALQRKGERKRLNTMSTGDRLSAQAVDGDISMECPSAAKIVRIFTSSTFTDTKHERDEMMKHAYPRVKTFCRKLGYEFQVVDMRWGVRDEATDDHMGTELCLKELKLCQALSTGPNFVSLLSHKYGYTPLPRTVEATEFESMVHTITDGDTKRLLDKWYRKDDNSVPTAYTLSSISTHLPGFLGSNDDEKKTACTTWWQECDVMQGALEQAALTAFDAETARKYVMSVTETEVRDGLLNIEDPGKHCLWLKRNIEDIEQQESSSQLARYIECTGPESKWTKSRQMLKELKEDKMVQKLDSSKILNYSVNWNANGGINPDVDQSHSSYIEKLMGGFTRSLTAMIETAVAERTKTDDPLIDECIEHVRFCQSKTDGFYGREDILKKIETYLTSKDTTPLVLHGTSGTGKTSVMAMVAELARKWINPAPAVVVRFIGTSSKSSSLIPLLRSIMDQMMRILNTRSTKRISEFVNRPQVQGISERKGHQIVLTEFKLAVMLGRAVKPLVIILDSLDQLDPANEALALRWLPNTFPQSSKVIVSTLPGDKYECFTALKAKIKSDNFIDLPVMHKDDVSGIIDKWLNMRKRMLTENQRHLVEEAFDKCPTPLFLKLSFEEAVLWTSFAPPGTTVLQDTVRSSIDHLFQRLEKLHGTILVSRTLAYLTTCRNGATESELEDILSCDDDVLNDVYMYWTPPIRRLPPLLLVRIRTDINQYLVEREADGMRVMYWYHRQFTEAAASRYCSDTDNNLLIHSNLADFFAGTWADGKKKPYVSGKGVTGEEDRKVSGQPLVYDRGVYNVRAMHCLPYHRTKAGQPRLLAQQCLANYEFVLMKLKCMPMSQVIEDYQFAKEHFPEDELINTILEALLLSQAGLSYDPGQLAPQMIGRLELNGKSAKFLDDCRNYPQTIILPSKSSLTKQGGQLVYKMTGHKRNANMMNMSESGKYVLTVCPREYEHEEEVTLWEVATGRLLRSVVDVGGCTTALFCHGDEWTAFKLHEHILVAATYTGKVMFKIETPVEYAICTAGNNRDTLLVFFNNGALIYDLSDKYVDTVTHPDMMKFGAKSISFGTENLVAVADVDQEYITVLDLGTKSFYKKFGLITEMSHVNAIAITPDEQSVAYTAWGILEVIFADPKTGERQRSFNYEKEHNRYFQSPKFTADGRMMLIHDSTWLRIFDVETFKEIDALEHTNTIIASDSRDMNIVVTLTYGHNVCVWDRRRQKQDNKSMDSVFNYTSSVFAEYLPNSRYILGAARKDKTDTGGYMYIYDVLQDKLVKEIELPDVELLHTFPDSKTILVCVQRKIMLVDLDTASLVTTFQGHAANNISNDSCRVTDRNELVTLSKCRMNVKVYDVTTGKVSFIVKGGQKERLQQITTNKAGSIAACNARKGHIYVFDLINRRLLYAIPQPPYLYRDRNVRTLINDTGTHLLFSRSGIVMETLLETGHLVVWSVQNEAKLCLLVDKEYETKYMAREKLRSTCVRTAQFLGDNSVITNHDDYIIRIFNYRDGTLLHRLIGHLCHATLSVVDPGPYILSHGDMMEEHDLRLWDRETFACVATYTLDKSIRRAILSPDGNYFVTLHKTPVNVVRWNIHNGKAKFHEEIYPVLYAEAGPVRLEVADTFVPEEGDPDSGDDADDADYYGHDDDDDEDVMDTDRVRYTLPLGVEEMFVPEDVDSDSDDDNEYDDEDSDSEYDKDNMTKIYIPL